MLSGLYNTLCWLSGGCECCQGCTVHYAGCVVVVKVFRVVQYNYCAGCSSNNACKIVQCLYNINAFIKLLLARYGQKLFNVSVS